MEKVYDDKWYKAIKKLIYEDKKEKAFQFLTEYLNKYPDDITAYNLYVELLFICDDFDKIEQYPITLSNEEYEPNMYIENYFEMKKMMYLGQYENILLMYEILKNGNNKLLVDQIKSINLFARCKLGMSQLSDHKNEKLSYTNTQILDYRIDRLKQHIEKHSCDNNYPDEGNFKYNNIDIDSLIEMVDDNIDIAYVNHSIYFCDYYIFKKRCIVIDKNHITTDYLKVIVIPFDNSIITIYPISSIEIKRSNKIIDLDLLDLEKLSSPINKESRIEKFKQKYKKF